MDSLIINTFPLGRLQTNCYVLTNENGSFYIVVDPGDSSESVVEFLKKKTVDYILLTHCHYDHIAGLNTLKKYFDAPVIVHYSEAHWLTEPALNLSEFKSNPICCEWPEILLHGDEIIKCDSHNIRVIHTPGHSPGSVSYVIGQFVFTGDTLMAGLIGPTTLPHGNREQLILSIKEKLFNLHDDMIVLPGHGGRTTIGNEKKFNQFPRVKTFYPNNNKQH